MKHFRISTLLVCLITQPALAQQRLSISRSVPIFCRDSRGTLQPIVRTTYGRLQDAFRQQFNFTSSLTANSPGTGTLTFRGGQNNSETISYSVSVHNGGIALLNMRTRLAGTSENLTGNQMCWQTFSIVNVG